MSVITKLHHYTRLTNTHTHRVRVKNPKKEPPPTAVENLTSMPTFPVQQGPNKMVIMSDIHGYA